jgi:cell division control protein 6
VPQLLANEVALSPAFVPSHLPHREAELARLYALFSSLPRARLPCNAQITGPVGSGKTALALTLARELKARALEHGLPLETVYLNCRRESTDTTVWLKLLRAFDPQFPDRGFSKAEMLDSLEGHLRERRGHLLVVLDEAGNLLARSSDVLYDLTRARETGFGAFSCVLISSRSVRHLMDPSTRSSFGAGNTVDLRRYAREELKGIVRQRIDLAFHPGACDRDLDEGIASAAQELGDARFAIELLHTAAKIAEARGAETVSAEDVRAAKGATYPTVSDSRLGELDLHHLALLLAVARKLKRGEAFCGADEARGTYETVCEELGNPPRSRATVHRMFRNLELKGYLDIVVPGSGRASMIYLNDAPADLLEARIAEKVEGRKVAAV